MGRHRYRWWFRLTGLPGWLRMGFSPGWFGYNPYQPAVNQFFPQPAPQPVQNTPPFYPDYAPYGAAPITPEQELNILKGQAEVLEDELQGIRNEIKELEKELSGGE
ncbi:MAG TPA: hypothetical protein ENI34_10055 [candidate division WOR-3 bacterium]|uniref:DUF5320 domain-containing protein n=1 Tax=candidate division WOR-3 bacterium TaxID=2052148 RepID=A0A9C9EPI7_UNCW3|nr:hypothetical protein [candidate division WOR-3 bacterium]